MKQIFRLLSVLFLFALVASAFLMPEVTAETVSCAVFAPLLWPAGADNMGGYKNRLLFIPQDAVSSVPTLPASTVSDDDYVTAAGSFVFKDAVAGKPTAIYATPKSVGYKADSQGEEDCKSYKHTGEFFHPGNKKAADILARKIANTPGYLILEDNENQYIVGQPGYPCTITASYDGGKAAADKRGFSFTFDFDSVCPKIHMGTPIDIDALFV